MSSKVIEARRIAYGPDDFHFGDLRLPRTGGSHPVAIMVHGGFWRSLYGLEYFDHACAALTDAGIATWNMEYRRLGNPGGGWPGTFEDVSEGAGHVARIADEFNLDLDRIIAVGHSAGGHLALWLAGREKRFRGVISLAGIADLNRAWELRLSNTAVAELLGGSPEEVPERYQFASPIDHLPIGTVQMLFHGTEDTDVPYEISERYVRKAQLLGDDAQLITFENAGHLEPVDPRTKEFSLVRDTALSLVGAVK